MPRTLSAAIETLRESSPFTFFDAIEIQLPFSPGDSAPIVIRAASASDISLTGPYDFLIFTYKAFTGAFDRAPTSAEQDDWDADLQTGFDTSPTALYDAAVALIDDLFADAEYTARMRTDPQFINDLYMAYLGRVPDIAGYAFWVANLAISTRAAVQAAFSVDAVTSDEFRARVAGLNQSHEYDADIRDKGTISLTDGAADDGGTLGLQNLGNDYSVPLSQPTRQVYPAPMVLSRVFVFEDGTYEADPMIVGFAEFTGVDGQSAKLNAISDMSRKGLDVIQPITQRCKLRYKQAGCDSPDPSPTCSLVFDDAVNGCAQKMPAPQIIDTDPGVQQVETATVIGTITGSGNAAVIVTAAAMTNSPKTIQVPVVNTDSASVVAGKIRTALTGDVDVGHSLTGLFDVSGAGANIILTTKRKKANDSTVNVSIANGTCTGLTAAPTSTNTTAGVEGLNNQASFQGVPPLNEGTSAGLTPDDVGPNGWPDRPPFDPNDPVYGHGRFGGMLP